MPRGAGSRICTLPGSARRGVPVLDPWEGREEPGEVVWEGGGDSLWHPGRHFLWAGYGQRSQRAAHQGLSRTLRVPMALLRLVDPVFYHLDTCLALLDRETAVWVPEAFDETARELLRHAFPRLLEVEAAEARGRLAANLYCPDGKAVLLPDAAPRTRRRLEEAGFRVREVPLDEFLKSGGSVFCLKQELPLGC